MSTLRVGIRSPLLYPNVTNTSDIKAGDVVAATPLGRDENGKNLVAYIVRTEDEAPQYKLPNSLANSNTPKKSFLSDTAPPIDPASAQPKTKLQNPVQPKQETTSAQFIKPDDLLSRLEQSQVNQLRERDNAIRNDTTKLNDGAGNALLTALIYNSGPDGRRYAVGVSAPLSTQQAIRDSESQGSELLGSESQEGENNASPLGKAATAYRQSAYFNATDFRSTLFNKAI
jgi:hypothetical protein